MIRLNSFSAILLTLSILSLSGCADFAETKSAAERGESWAFLPLGQYYLEGRETARNSTEATKWLEKAATSSSNSYEIYTAAEQLARMYGQGDGVEKNLEKSELWQMIYQAHYAKYQSDAMATIQQAQETQQKIRDMQNQRSTQGQ